jgi:hypothetical protein
MAQKRKRCPSEGKNVRTCHEFVQPARSSLVAPITPRASLQNRRYSHWYVTLLGELVHIRLRVTWAQSQ